MKEILKQLLIRDEGLRFFPYMDTVGKLTIGVGRNLTDTGITESEAMLLLDNDIEEACDLTYSFFKEFYMALNDVRKMVLINMVFNMGGRVLSFKRMRHALRNQDYEQAATQMLDSKWAKQVKGRATRLAQMMASGKLNERSH